MFQIIFGLSPSTKAQVLLEFAKPTFPIIGALEWKPGKWEVTKRPLTVAMNELVRVGNLPPHVFSNRTFTTANEYFEDLANQHLLHLRYQRNDAVVDEEDCRRKYIARCLFRKIAREEFQALPGPFPLYCDDLRPSNVLAADDLTVTGVID